MQASELLPDLDVGLLVQYMRPDEQFDAVMEFREVVRG